MDIGGQRKDVIRCPKDSIGETQEIRRVRHPSSLKLRRTSRRINIEEATGTCYKDCIIIVRNDNVGK